jgi:TatA/E family protein of Tat protein translocase
MSGGELLLLLLIALLALGAHRLPKAGGMLGKGLREFHRALNEARGARAEDQDPPRAPRGSSRLID